MVMLLAGIFTIQIFDIPPSRNMSNPHTCCGRAICMCKHAKGAQCPFRHGMSDDSNMIQRVGESKVVAPVASHKSCHLNKTESPKMPQAAAPSKAVGGFAFTKAPCATDAPKSVLPQYSKDFLFPASSGKFLLMPQGTIPVSSFDALLLLREHGIYRPPRSISFSF